MKCILFMADTCPPYFFFFIFGPPKTKKKNGDLSVRGCYSYSYKQATPNGVLLRGTRFRKTLTAALVVATLLTFMQSHP
jgi:hypothetical protein